MLFMYESEIRDKTANKYRKRKYLASFHLLRTTFSGIINRQCPTIMHGVYCIVTNKKNKGVSYWCKGRCKKVRRTPVVRTLDIPNKEMSANVQLP